MSEGNERIMKFHFSISDFIKDISPYVPGKPIEELQRELGIKDIIKLASNENPLGPSKKAISAIRKGLKELNRYPDGSCYYLKMELSKKLGVSTEELIIGNGSNELIDIVAKTLLMPGRNAVMGKPSFIVYAMATKIAGARAVEVPLTSDSRHDLTGMLDAVDSNTGIVFIANPNNPTGTINKREEFDAFMKRVPGNVLVVIDEAYYEYVTSREYPDSLEYFKKGYPLLILRTFSKIYGLAGLRIGYGIGPAQLIREMNRVREPFNVNSLAQIAAIHALKDREHIKRSASMNKREKTFLYKELKRLGIDFLPTEANFIYMKFPFEVQRLFNEMLKRGIIIRPVGKNEIRVTIGTRKENVRFIKALEGIIKEGGHQWT
ncbi:MAG: histidinol-phosphate transaminase [Thermodesulfovibrionales bacterium]|nr:histidinol-phosphate transaminase [Thermodesulfovibrionales bacterium]